MTSGADQRDTALVMGAYLDALLHEAVSGALPIAEGAIVNTAVPAVTPPPASFAPRTAPAVAGGSYQMISVRGITLGVPVEAVDTIIPLDSVCVSAEAAADGMLGCYTAGADTITVLDTARLLLPDQAAAAAHRGFALRLKNQPWALHCDTVGSTFAPAPEAITWRGANGKRLWLAGTVREPGCALLDIPELMKLLPR